MRISSQQVQTFRELAEARFLRDLCGLLRDGHADAVGDLDDDELLRWASASPAPGAMA